MANNLFSNLLVIGILGALLIMIYCKIKDKTLLDVFHEVMEMINGGVDEQVS